MNWLLPLVLLLSLSGCGGGYVAATSGARAEFYSGQFDEAAKKLEKSAHTEGKDQLLYLLDRATALHQASLFEESNKDFLLADKIAEISDYTSISKEVSSLVVTEEIGHYKGDEYEYVLISQYLALNFLMLGKTEDALVESRRVNQKLYRLVNEGKRKYNLNPMAMYLVALLYENSGEWEDSYIDYQGVRKLHATLPYLREDLYRLAWRTKNHEDMSKWVDEFGLSSEEQKKIRDTAGDPEVVFIIENGRAPQKEPNPQWQAIPKFYSKYNPTDFVQITAKNETGEQIAEARSFDMYDVEKVANQNMDEKYGPLLAKKIAGLVVKGVIAAEIGKNTDPGLGYLVFQALNAMDSADTRSWLTLPKSFQIARVRLPRAGGSFTVKIQPLTASNSSSGAASTVIEKIIHVEAGKPRQRFFVPVRIY